MGGADRALCFAGPTAPALHGEGAWDPVSRVRFPVTQRGARVLPLLVAVLFATAAACVLPACASAPGNRSTPAVAVWDPEDVSPGAAAEQGIGEVLALRIMETIRERGIPVVERGKLLLAVEELRLGSSALAEESTKLRLGRITGARQMVFGGYLSLGNRVRMDLRLVDVETGKVLRTATRTGPAAGVGSLLDLCGKAAADLFPGGG